jgi:hypothetical protein
LGSTAFFGNVDTVINMVMESGRRYASAEQQRYGAHLGKTELLMEPETDRVVVADGPQATPDSSVRIRAEIRSSLQQGTKTTEEIKVLVGGKTESVLDVLTGMVESGEILGTGKGVRGDPKRYSLKPSPSPTSDSVSHSAPVEKPDRELKAVEGPRSSPIKEHRLERKSRATPTSETIKVTGQEIAEALRVDRAA